MQVIWSPIAEETYIETLQLILKKWSLKEALAFDQKSDAFINNIKKFKHLCPPAHNNPALRRCTITEQTYMVYETIDKTTIELVAFFDNRSLHHY